MSDEFDRQKWLEMRVRQFQIERAKREAEAGIPETLTEKIDFSDILKGGK